MSNQIQSGYCVLIKVLEGKGKAPYRFAVIMVNRKSDKVYIPENNSFKMGEAYLALELAEKLRFGTHRPLHISLSGYAGSMNRLDAEVLKEVSGIPMVTKYVPVDAEHERALYYASFVGSESPYEFQDFYDNSSTHYG